MEVLVRDTVERFGDLHAVVNNAGFLRDRMVFAMTEDDFDSVVNVHLKGTFNVLRHACAYWRERAKAGHRVSGRIVNTTSGTGLFGNVGQANYGAAKAGIVSLSTITALEMERYGVTVNSLAPLAATRMTAGLFASEESTERSWDPMDPANASPLVAWLCSEEAGWVTGQVFRVDGHTVMKVEPFRVGASYRSKSGEALTIDELSTGMRRLFGSFPPGVPERAS
jgi:NAD(P)-dependent dehydrogenase (short-subunit alcohol dehydrogenase family)